RRVDRRGRRSGLRVRRADRQSAGGGELTMLRHRGRSACMLPMTPACPSPADHPPQWFTTALATPAEQASTTVDGAAIAYRSWGSGAERGLVLVHGGAAHSWWWDHVAPLLAGSGKVVALDLSGHGDSDRRDSY